MSNGVRNLRAMFENGNAAASPEPRGRSPIDNAAATEGDERPKSKVRASFVSVEPTGAHPTRRESFRVSQDQTDELAELKKAIVDDKEQRTHSVAIPEAVPEHAVASRESSIPAPPIRQQTRANTPNLGSIMKGSAFPDSSPAAHMQQLPRDDTALLSPQPASALPAENPDKATTGVQDDVALRPAAPTDEAAVKHDEPALEDPTVSDDALVPQQDANAEEAAVVEETATTDESSAPAPAPTQTAENPDKAAAGPQDELALRPASPTGQTTLFDATAPPASTEAAAVAPSRDPTTQVATPAEAKLKPNGVPAVKKPDIKKPATISTAKPTTAPSAPAKSPLPNAAPKTPTKPSPAAKTTKPVAHLKPAAPKEPVKSPVAKAPIAKAPTAKASLTSLRPAVSSSSATAPTAPAASKPKLASAPVENKRPVIPKPATSAPRKSTSPTGFKKPTPKSPTRPVGLPARLTAPTAASAAKHGEEPKVARKPSTTARPAPKAPAPKTSRPSIAPPAPKRPESRASTASAAPKGGFLERMMRPTAASSSKTHDKPHEKPSSPPRKAPVATKPSTLQKGKRKAEEVVTKAKAVVTNGDSEEHKDVHENGQDPEHDHQAPEETPATETSHESEKPATPVQHVDSSVAELQTPNFPEETVR